MPRKSSKGKVKGDYKGVRLRSWGRWVCEIRVPNSLYQNNPEEQGGKVWLGSFGSPVKAAFAYDFAAFYFRGHRAKLNFPGSPPPSHSHHYPTKWQIKEAASRYADHMTRKKTMEHEAGSAAPCTEHVRSSCSATSTSSSSNNSKDEDISSQLKLNIEDLEIDDSGVLPQQYFYPLDDQAIEGLCGFLTSHSHTDWGLEVGSWHILIYTQCFWNFPLFIRFGSRQLAHLDIHTLLLEC